MVLESNTLDVLFVKDGQQGEDGKVLYTWIKYAKDANGTGMTDDPNGAIYIGISYNNESSIESNDPTQYAWTKIQGADGKKGEDAYTIFLENENISFATDENRNPLSEQAYTSGITIMKGAKPVTDFTIGDIAKTQGIAVAKTDTAIAISVVNGNPLPNDSGEIEIPITVGGTVFKKILTWTCAKKGDQGEKGEQGKDGTSVTIINKSITYQLSTSGTAIPTGAWQTSPQTIPEGQYQWTKTSVTYSDGNKTESYSISYHGKNGNDGTSVTVSKTEVTYQVSTSGTTAPTGTWSTTMPSCDQGQYLWTKTYVKYSDGKDTTSYSVSYKGVDGEKFAFNMLRETNQGSKHWINIGASGKYSVESITTEDSINAVKLICTEPIASNEWQFCDFSDYEMLKSLKASTTYTLSYDIKANRSGKILHNIKTGGGQKIFFANDISCKVLGNETWEHVSLQMTSGTTLPNLDKQVIYMFGDALSKVGYSIIKNLKLTEGIVDTPWAPHPEDLEGRGVSEIVQYYLATSQASGVTSSTSGWSTDITTQKLTADKKYLWNCYQTKYSDGTSEPISTPKVIGVYGDKGNGIVASVQRPNKTEFWWSQVGAVGHKDTFDDSSNIRNNCRVGDIFTVMGTSTEGNSHTAYYKSTTDSGDLAGECINHVVAESGADAKNLSITPSSQYFKSTDGGKTFAPNTIKIKPTIQGEISFGKWQYSIDGGVSFADVVSGQKGLTINNNVLTVSKDSSLYTDAVTMITFRAVSNDSSFYDTCSIAKIYDVSDIGDGRNLLWNSNFAKTDEAIRTSAYTTWGLCLRGNTYTATIDTSVKHNDFNTLKVVGTKAGENGGQDLIYRIKGLNLNEIKFTETGAKYTLSFYAKASVGCNFSVRYAYDSYAKDTNAALGTDWKRYEIQMHPTTTSYQTTLIFKMDAASTVYFSEFKLEKGSSATGYSTAPEDIQTAILSTKSQISDVSLKVDNNKQAIEQRVEKTTYERELTLVKGDISKANEGLNKWRYEIYPKSLFTDKPEDQNKYDIGVFIRNKNLTPSRTLVFDDNKWTLLDYENNYIGYGLTFVKMSAKKTFSTKWAHSSSCSIYVNGKLIISDEGTVRLDSNNTGRDFSCTFIEGWNCIEFVMQETTGNEWFFFKDAISAISECQLMNCYYGTPVARQSHITNQLVENTTNIKGISTKVSKVTSVIGDNGENFTSFQNDYSDFKQTMNGFKTTVGQTYVTKDDFNGLEIGGRNLLLYSQTIRAHKDYYGVGWLTDEVETFNGCPVWSVKNQWGRLTWLFKSHVIDRGLVKVGDTLTYSLYAKTNNASGKSINCSYRFKGNANAYWFNGSAFNVGTNWTRYSVTFTITKDMLATDTYMTEIGFEETASMSGDDKVYYACPKLERGTKATDYTPALEDNEINGQNLVSNLSSNWEQGSVSYVANSTYASIKTVLATRLRTEDVFSVSGNVTISAGTSTNSSKEELNFYYVLFDVNKKAIGVPASGSEWQSLTSPKIINCGDAKYMAIILRWGSGSTVITPSNISQICLKIERGTSATPFTLAPEDVNGKIVNVETIANQTANKFEWIVKGGDKSSSMVLTDDFLNIVANKINLKGKVTFESLSSDAKNEIGKVAQSKVDNLNIGGRNLIINSNLSRTLTNVTNDGCSNMTVVSDSVYGHALKFTAVNQRRVFWATSNVWVKDKTYTVSFVAKSSVTGQKIRPSRSTADWGDDITLTTSYARYTTKITSMDTNAGGTLSFSCTNAVGDITITNVKLEVGSKPTDWTPAPEDYLPQANLVSNWTTNTTWIDGGKIYTGSITADKIATDAIKSRNYISSGGTQGSFLNLSDGSFQSPNLSWDANGNLIAKNANLSGEIAATKGTIGGWNIKDSLYSNVREPYDINKYYAKKILNKPSFRNICMNTNVLSAANYGTVSGDHVTVGDSIIATNTAYSFGVNISLGRISLFGSTYYTSDLASELNKSSSLTLSGDKISFWEYDEDGYEISEQNNTYITSNYARFSGDIFIGGDIGTDGGADIGGKLQASSIAAKNGGLIETAGTIYGGGEIQCGGGQMRIIGGDYGILLRNDGSDFYILSTDSGNQWGYWNSKRPFRINLANGIPYFEYGIIIPNENYLLGNGYQIARGTSWGGVCIGDDSKGLRFYGTSIWASHSISTSDENLKENFTSLDQYEDFYMNLNPIGFNYIGDYDGKKTHFGFGAHKTEDILESEGYDSDKFAVVTHRPLVQDDIEKRFGKDIEVDIEIEYGISYTEFIALNTHMIQKTRKELTKVKQEKADLEARLQAIEAKLGL